MKIHAQLITRLRSGLHHPASNIVEVFLYSFYSQMQYMTFLYSSCALTYP